MNALGWLGSIALALCGLPQAIECYRKGNSRGLSWAFLLLWFFGELFTLAYVWDKSDIPLIVNYVANIGLLLVMLKFKLWERKS